MVWHDCEIDYGMAQSLDWYGKAQALDRCGRAQV